MKITVSSVSQFADQFYGMGRGDNFSYEALQALFDYFEENDPDMELDVIGICCDYSEMSLEDINREYGQEFEDINDASDWLEQQTTVIAVLSASVVVQDF